MHHLLPLEREEASRWGDFQGCPLIAKCLLGVQCDGEGEKYAVIALYHGPCFSFFDILTEKIIQNY